MISAKEYNTSRPSMVAVTVVVAIIALFSAWIAHPAPASAAVVNGGNLTSGSPVSASISVPNNDISYSFSATAGRHVTFDVASSAWTNGSAAGSAYLYFYRPDGTYINVYIPLGQTATYSDFIPDVSGTWKAVLDPYGASTGRVTFTFAHDPAVAALSDGLSTTVTATRKGGNIPLTFSATAGRHVTFDVTSSAWTNGTAAGSAYLYFYRPDGTYINVYIPLSQTAAYNDFIPDVSGTWKALLDPYGASTGKVTFTYAQDPIAATLADGPSTSVTVAHKGGNAPFAFSATAGRHVSFDVSLTSWTNGGGSGSAYIYFYRPDGTYINVYIPLGQTATYTDFTPDVSGTWRAVLDPYGASTGKVTFAYAQDPKPVTLTKGISTTATVTHRGANIPYRFAATAGQLRTITVSSSSWSSGSNAGLAYLYVYRPDGSYANVYLPLGQTATHTQFTPNVSGNWSIVIDPYGASVGRATFSV